MERKDLLIEEYKELRASLRHHQTAYFALENYTFGGTLIVYGVLLGVTTQTQQAHVPVAVWWGVFLLIIAACVRCWGHYVVVRKIAAYLRLIEKAFYTRNSVPEGFESFHLKGIFAPWLHLGANAFVWIVLVAITFGFALLKTIGRPIP